MAKRKAIMKLRILFLRGAQEGYEFQINQGCHYYEKMPAEVEEILQKMF